MITMAVALDRNLFWHITALNSIDKTLLAGNWARVLCIALEENAIKVSIYM